MAEPKSIQPLHPSVTSLFIGIQWHVNRDDVSKQSGLLLIAPSSLILHYVSLGYRELTMQKMSRAYQNVHINTWSNIQHEYTSSLCFNSPNWRKGRLSAANQEQKGNSLNFPNTQSYLHHSRALSVIRYHFRMRNSHYGTKVSGCKQSHLWHFHL